MSNSMWGYFFILMGVMAGVLLLLFGNINTKNEQNYYLLKEVTEAAMLDSVDREAYQAGLKEEDVKNIDSINCVSGQPGTIRIIKEFFVESFTRRFAQLASTNKNYTIKFYDINECPARVNVKVESTQNYSLARRLFEGSYDTSKDNTSIVNQLSAILESE